MKMTGARILVETLIEQGVDTVFGYPGGQVLNIYDELYQNSDRLRHVLAAHEQGAAHAADGYSRATGKVGVVIATSGPGATNLVTGIATAMLDSVPMVAITGNVPCDLIGRDSFQEIDITGITLPITKHNYFVQSADDLANVIREAFKIAKSGRPGPVLIDIPKDVQINLGEYEKQSVVEPFPNKIASQADIDRAAEVLKNSSRPYIYIGGGVAGAGMAKDICALADKIDAFIGCSFMGLSAVPSENRRFLGMQGMHGHYASSVAQDEADVILAVGVRFSDRATGKKSRYAKNAKIIHLDLDFSEINKNIAVEVGVCGDIIDSFKRIAEAVPGAVHPAWDALVTALRAKENESYIQTDKLTPKRAIDIINAETTPETVIATDVGQHQMWAAQYCEITGERGFITSGGLGTMGFGMGAAIGASLALGKKPVVLYTGDGSFGMNLIELATAVSYNVPLIVVVMNNSSLGMVKQWQKMLYRRTSQSELHRETDFVKVAKAFGAKGMRAMNRGELKEALNEAMELVNKRKPIPFVIDCVIDPEEKVVPTCLG